jgi:hypothetical protein
MLLPIPEITPPFIIDSGAKTRVYDFMEEKIWQQVYLLEN